MLTFDARRLKLHVGRVIDGSGGRTTPLRARGRLLYGGGDAALFLRDLRRRFDGGEATPARLNGGDNLV